MEQLKSLWGVRVKEYWNMAIRYLRLIGNSGFLFTIYIAIIAGSYYYSELLKWLPSWFPAAPFLAVVTALLLTKSKIRTFLKEADIVFLSPLEGNLNGYFRASFFYSYIIQAFSLVFMIILFTPMYRYFIASEEDSLLSIIIALIISKGWNLLLQWEESRLQFASTRFTHQLLRFLINVTLTFLLFNHAPIYYIIAIFILKISIYLLYYHHIKKVHSIKWEHLIDVEERIVMFFYRIANLFTDVPKLTTKVKSRKLVNTLVDRFRIKEKNTYLYLYMKSFIRSNDYFGIYIRLLLIGLIFIFYIPIRFGPTFAALLILYMSALQLSTLQKHHSLKLWLDLYPLSIQLRNRSFSQIVFMLLCIKLCMFTIFMYFATRHFVEPAFVFGAGVILSYVYSFLTDKKV